MDTATLGVLSGSVAFTRGDAAGGSNEIGGTAGTAASTAGFAEVGVFINTAVGNAYENTPGVASGKGPYVSGQGTYANSLYETLGDGGLALTNGYTTGDSLFASVNGYLITFDAAGIPNPSSVAIVGNVTPATAFMLGVIAPIMGILKMPADAVQPEIVYDQRI
jgi:hypothetical protein